MFDFIANHFHYLTVTLSNCTWNGSVFLTEENLFSLEDLLRAKFVAIENLEFRGVGASMVRGNTNSLTLGIAAGYFYQKQNLDDFNASELRTQIRSSIAEAGNLAFSEIRIEATRTGRLNV